MKTRKDMYKNANMKQKKMKTKMKDKINKGKKRLERKIILAMSRQKYYRQKEKNDRNWENDKTNGRKEKGLSEKLEPSKQYSAQLKHRATVFQK